MLFLSAGCRFNPDVQYEGADYLQGIWVQDSVPMQDILLQYTSHELSFTCDSIYATLHTTSKVKNIADSCYNDGRWTEHAKGVYVVRGDSLLVDGQYTNADLRPKTSGCYRIGQYLPRFKIVRYSADSLVLENRHDQRSIVLRKKADITCIPKKRWE
ncbi:fumarate hydratase [Parapedobacter deserti]|uniref:Fumarate hydratase n=1 Tax=Parapedobacter deserti TaxID=1912957 RepID=A0ABV7JMI4_9SPHI